MSLSLPLLFAVICTSASDECAKSKTQLVSQQATHDLVDTATQAGNFQTLLAAVEAAGLVETLKGEGPFTVFAPTDAAFAAIPEKTLAGLLANKEALKNVLLYHVAPGRVPAKDVVSKTWIPTAQGQSLLVHVQEDGVTIDGAKVVTTDIACSNGVIHVLDTVVMPRKNLVETAVAAGSFQTLVQAVKAADLVETLANGGPFTVFAPADSAFAKLPEHQLAALLEDEHALRSLLTFHVVPGRVLSTDLPKGEKLSPKTVQGEALEILRDAKTGAVHVQGAQVVKADIVCGNGVIHVVDAVLMPGHAGTR